MTMTPAIPLATALNLADETLKAGTLARDPLASLTLLAEAVRAYQAEQAGTWTVIGAWIEDEAIVTGVIQGTHAVYGGDDYDAFPQGCWATSAMAPDADTAEAMAVEEMMATLEHDDDDEDDEEQL